MNGSGAAPPTPASPSRTTTPSTTGRARDSALTRTVLGHANTVYRKLAATDQGSGAERLAAEAGRFERDETEVVVVGDIKRGKSSLVNALIDSPGLLPVDADVATAVHLTVQHGESLGATVLIDEDGERIGKAIDISEIVQYAAVSGAHADRGDVKAVEVRLPHPMLTGGLTLVDTPGVGGMTRGHRDITMAALARADVLLFTLSVQEPVTRSELEFLSEASERIGSVLLAVTRCDLATAQRQAEHVAETRARIRAQAASIEGAAPDAADRLRRIADGPVALTSSYIAEQSLRRRDRGQNERADELMERSGVLEVRARLEGAVDAKKLLRLANVLQLIAVLLTPRIAAAEAKVAAAEGDESGMRRLEEARERLERAAGQQARWRASLASTFARLQAEAGRDVSRELTIVRDHYRDALAGDKANRFTPEELRGIRSQLGDSLTAAWANLAYAVTQRFEDIVSDLLEELSLEAEPGLLGEFTAPATLATEDDPGTAGSFSVLDDGLPLAMQTFMFSNITSALLGVLGVATGGIGILAYGVGVAVAAPVALLRRQQRERRTLVADLLRESNESLFGQEGVMREFTTELTLRIISAREQLETLIESRLGERRQQLESEHRELVALLKSEQSSRHEARQLAQRELGELRALAEQTSAHAAAVVAQLQQVTEQDRRAADSESDTTTTAASPTPERKDR